MNDLQMVTKLIDLFALRASQMSTGQENDLWTPAIANLAVVMAETILVLTPEQQTLLVGIGALMTRHAAVEVDCRETAAAMISRAVKKGGAV